MQYIWSPTLSLQILGLSQGESPQRRGPESTTATKSPVVMTNMLVNARFNNNPPPRPQAPQLTSSSAMPLHNPPPRPSPMQPIYVPSSEPSSSSFAVAESTSTTEFIHLSSTTPFDYPDLDDNMTLPEGIYIVEDAESAESVEIKEMPEVLPSSTAVPSVPSVPLVTQPGKVKTTKAKKEKTTRTTRARTSKPTKTKATKTTKAPKAAKTTKPPKTTTPSRAGKKQIATAKTTPAKA